ncbi:hypothetical protein C8046_11505 [Serinibacter arcticus]|uniref:Sel1 repeat family protein n=1 Tax=Serinibacter arcticus TaxID=1655435 RepID=A0A2U1ZW33_9MICO|nr:tetratricopeptide repeat protein [Serinibacter arcticus]PWD51181.1 hypothetical protein C8046_11505 [Serinibacter arcticus]
MKDAYLAADRKGSRLAALIWVRRDYFARVEPAGPAVARLEELVVDDPDGAAHLLRGWIRGQGYGYPQDWAASAADLETSAAAGNADALFELSVLAATGRGMPQDDARSRDHLDRAAAVGHPRALYNVAAEHATGRGRPQDSARALELYVRAAEQGHARAAWTAGVMTLTGEGTRPDADRAGHLLLEARDLGFDLEGATAALPDALRQRVVAALDGRG